MEEEIGIEKVARETGHVRIHKTIKVEEKHFSVPVMREDVVIERIAVSSDEPTLPSESAFQEQTLDSPLHEEDVKVSKRSRLREQMVIRTVVEAIQKDASADLRHEECEVEDTRPGKSEGWSGSPRSSSSSSSDDTHRLHRPCPPPLSLKTEMAARTETRGHLPKQVLAKERVRA